MPYPSRSTSFSPVRDRVWRLSGADKSDIGFPYNEVVDYRPFIKTDPQIRSGKPCVAGTRISVFDVLDYLASGMSVDDVVADFPQLSRESVLACLAYAADRERRVAHSRA